MKVVLPMSQRITNKLLQFILLEQCPSSELAGISFRQLNKITSIKSEFSYTQKHEKVKVCYLDTVNKLINTLRTNT